jgi:uncharacterized protein YjbI with pentapeptide repeats
MTEIHTIMQFIECYKRGQRLFTDLEFENGESFSRLNIIGTTFKNCWFCADFAFTDLTDCEFINCNLKTSDFSFSNLTRARFVGCAVESTEFKGAVVKNLEFENNSAYSSILGIKDFLEIYNVAKEKDIK